jgi:multiple sugar transport system ATP-binding protein
MAAITLKNLAAPGLEETGLDLTIPDRSFVVLAGPIGCGNSAILRLIAGLEKVARGKILLDERRLNEVAPKDREVAFVSHGHRLYPGVSVSRNIALALERQKFAATEIRKRVASVAEMLGIEKLLEANLESISDEDRQRIALARAMVRQPKVYLFDDPFRGLQSDARMRGRAEIAKLHQRSSATIIYATNDPTEAMAFGARTVILNGGGVQQDAAARVAFDTPANLFVAGFFGEPPMNLVHGIVKQERDRVLFSESGEGTIAVPLAASRFPRAQELAGKPVILGFRPDDIEMAAEGADRPASAFRALVERAEARGTETDLYLQTGAHQLICRSRRWTEQIEGGHRFQFEIQVGKAHLFDPDSGGRIMADRNFLCS